MNGSDRHYDVEHEMRIGRKYDYLEVTSWNVLWDIQKSKVHCSLPHIWSPGGIHVQNAKISELLNIRISSEIFSLDFPSRVL
jgi:hypothetical protein